MDENRRKEIIENVSPRILKNLDSMSGYSKLMYIKKLIGMLDDLPLIALDFAVEMTPEQPPQKGPNT